MYSAPRKKDYDGQMWGCNKVPVFKNKKGVPDLDATFEVHDMEIEIDIADVGMPHKEHEAKYGGFSSLEVYETHRKAALLCAENGITFYGVKKYDWIKTSRRIPVEFLNEIFDCYSNVVCYMIAFAIYLKYDHIDLYGVELNPWSRDIHELALVNAWLGIAIGRGMTFEVHGHQSSVMKNKDDKPYGNWE